MIFESEVRKINRLFMDASNLRELKLFVQQLETSPALLANPALRFFRDYLERFVSKHGTKLPPVAYGEEDKPAPCCGGHGPGGHGAHRATEAESGDDMPGLEEKSRPPKTYEDENVSEDESDAELKNEGVVESDDEPLQKSNFRCGRECKRLSDREYTCCSALEGVSVLLTGFSGVEKTELEELVTSMDGTLQGQAIPDVDFVIAKDVLATHYKWACHVVRKPVLMSSWLRQCAREHRQVPHDPHRMLPLAGLTICSTGFVLEDRYHIRRAALKNGAAYHGDLTKECSHLIAVLPEGQKYKVAKDWGLKVVSQNWFWESIKDKMCLVEALFPVIQPTMQDKRIFATHDNPCQQSPSKERMQESVRDQLDGQPNDSVVEAQNLRSELEATKEGFEAARALTKELQSKEAAPCAAAVKQIRLETEQMASSQGRSYSDFQITQTILPDINLRQEIRKVGAKFTQQLEEAEIISTLKATSEATGEVRETIPAGFFDGVSKLQLLEDPPSIERVRASSQHLPLSPIFSHDLRDLQVRVEEEEIHEEAGSTGDFQLEMDEGDINVPLNLCPSPLDSLGNTSDSLGPNNLEPLHVESRIYDISHLENNQPSRSTRLKGRLEKADYKSWTNMELEALVEGVRQHGQRWTTIYRSRREIFNNRDPTSLKDKWRNNYGNRKARYKKYGNLANSSE